MKKSIVTLISISLILTLFISTSLAISFSDLKTSHWAYKNIIALANEGIISGYTDGTYKPENDVTRGEFLKLMMVTLYDGNEYFEVNNFNFGHWAHPYAIEAGMAGYLMNGTDISNLNAPISRKEMVHILAKICLNNKIESKEEIKTIRFSDMSSLDAETKMYINFVAENGLINGYTDGTFKADRTMTRAEVATVISRFIALR